MNNNNNRNGQNGSPKTSGQQNNGYTGRTGTNQPRRGSYPNRQSVPCPPVKHRSRAQARRSLAWGITVAVILVLLLVCAIILLSKCVASGEGEANSEAAGSAAQSSEIQNGGAENEDLPSYITRTEIKPGYIEISVPNADVHKGYQILVNYEVAYEENGSFEIINVFDKKERNFYPFDKYTTIEKKTLDAFADMTDAFMEASGKSDIVISSGWRSIEAQKSIFDTYAETYGEDYATKYAAKPGHSEHHTGLALDLTVLGDGNSFATLPEYPEWMNANAHKYGFVLRYAEDKTDITKIAYEYWHYRYVGVPHAYYMKANNLCLEEYIDLLRGHDYYSPLSFTDDEGNKWEIYYARESIAEETKVIVPENGNYEISGNNVDGFIVTVNLGKGE